MCSAALLSRHETKHTRTGFTGSEPNRGAVGETFPVNLIPATASREAEAENAPFVAGEQKPRYGARRLGAAVVLGWESRAGTAIPREGPPKRAPAPRGVCIPLLPTGIHRVLPQKCWHEGRGRAGAAGAVVVMVNPNLTAAPAPPRPRFTNPFINPGDVRAGYGL